MKRLVRSRERITTMILVNAKPLPQSPSEFPHSYLRKVRQRAKRRMINGRQAWKSLGPTEFNSLLWNCSAFPMNGLAAALKQLVRLRVRHGTSKQACYDEAYEYMAQLPGVTVDAEGTITKCETKN